MYAALIALSLAAVAGPHAPAADRHLATRQAEAHRALEAEHARTSAAATALYNYASSTVVPDRHLAQQMTVELSRAVEAAATRFRELRETLGPDRRAALQTQLQLIGDWHAKAAGRLGDLKNELARPTVDGRELRFHSAAVDDAIRSAAAVHAEVRSRMARELAGRTGIRVR
jgi:hypothetical protein